MSGVLAVFNPSDYPRKGLVTTPWQPIYRKTKIAPEDLVLIDSKGNTLLAQVDKIDPHDTSLDTLCFSLVDEIPPGPEDYSSTDTFIKIEQGRQDPLQNVGTLLEIKDREEDPEWGVLLGNSRLEIFLNLSHTPGDDKRTWYAGSATSVRLEGREILEPFRGDMYGHDPDKRCMQIDYIYLCQPEGESNGHEDVRLFDRPFKLISASRGPVRVSITIASQSFPYPYVDPVTSGERQLECNLFRVFSLDSKADYIMEDLFVKGTLEGTRPDLEIAFKVRYFAHMEMGFEPVINRFPYLDDWFAIGSLWSPYPGYGFASTVHIGQISHPHFDPDFHDSDKEHKRFSWELQQSYSAHCMHIFMKGHTKFDSYVGHCWYENLYSPLKAEIL